MKQRSTTAIAAADDVGILDRLDRLHGGQSGVPGTNTDEPDPAHASTIARSTKKG